MVTTKSKELSNAPTRQRDIVQLVEDATNLLEKYGLESLMLNIIAGTDGEWPYTRIRLVDKNGLSDSWSLDWVGDE